MKLICNKWNKSEFNFGNNGFSRSTGKLQSEFNFKGKTLFSLNFRENKAGHTATPVACGWAEAVLEKESGAFDQQQ